MRYLTPILLIPSLLSLAVSATFYRDHVVYTLDLEPGSTLPLGVEVISSDLENLSVVPENVDWEKILKTSKFVKNTPPEMECVLVNSDPPIVEDITSGKLFVFIKGNWYEIEPRGVEIPVRVQESGRVVLAASGTWKAFYRLDDRLLTLSVFLASPFLKSAEVTLADDRGELGIGDVSGINTGTWKEIFQTFVDVENVCRIRVNPLGRTLTEMVIAIENTESNRLGFYLPSGSAVVLRETPTGRIIKDNLRVSGAMPGEQLVIHYGECRWIKIEISKRGNELDINVVNRSENAIDIRLEIALNGMSVIDSNPRYDELENGFVVFRTSVSPGENEFSLTLERGR